ncbi:hypothetical protein IV500_06345 [Paeniglutamicibacter antarcticus]|uniref:Uncharacterized protein n=1 Tax=Arthrobacter terrae TaxID=2935737 RepID=A0A931CM61_9MICC|nr:hypothetical protein [Arthrobacter terrae]MBG0739020.1 hypothetical protein [Arthrobacter terrae]
MSTSRQPKGIRTGGQFAAGIHTEPELSLNTATPAICADLVAARRVLSAQVGAMDVTAAAKGLKKRFRGAHRISAYRSSSQIYDPEEMTVRITDRDDRTIWEGSRAKVAQLGSLSLIPDKYQEEDSPLRTSRVSGSNGNMWRYYSIDKMAALTPEDLAVDG